MAAVRPSVFIPWYTSNPMSQDDVDKITEYFSDKGLEKFFVKMLIAVGKERPECPYTFMVSHMEAEGYTLPTGQVAELQDASHDMQEFVKNWQHDKEPTVNRTKDRLQLNQSGSFNFLGSSPKSTSKNVQAIFQPQEEGDAEGEPITDSPSVRSRGPCDSLAGDARCAEDVLAWDFDIFEHTDEELMRQVFRILQDGWQLPIKLNLNDNVLENYIMTVHANYRPSNSYHNFSHAFSVMAAVGMLLREDGQKYLDDIQTFAALISALTHDVSHPGTSNDYFVKGQHELAIRYNDVAVLENMHAALTFEMMRMPNNDILASFDTDQYQSFRKTAIAAILSTDMKVHFDLTSQLQAHVDKGTTLDPTDAAHRSLYHNCLVHAGDLSDPVRPTDLCKQWAYKSVLEFFYQAEKEKKEGMPFSPFMEHHPDNTLEFARLQVGFCSFVVKPFWGVLVKSYACEKTQSRMAQLEENITFWGDLKNEEEKDAENAQKE